MWWQFAGRIFCYHLTMAKLLFNLRNVSAEEADEVRALLDAQAIAYYETGAGLLGISVPALWLRDEQDFSRARQLLDDYQQARQTRIRAAYELARQRGGSPHAVAIVP